MVDKALLSKYCFRLEERYLTTDRGPKASIHGALTMKFHLSANSGDDCAKVAKKNGPFSFVTRLNNSRIRSLARMFTTALIATSGLRSVYL